MCITQTADKYQEIREGVRVLGADFSDRYCRGIDAERGYPEDFVYALTKAGWLAALIPDEYGGSGLGLADGSEGIGDGYRFIDRATVYAKDRVVFDRSIGRNQGMQFPIADSYIEIRAADLPRSF